MNRMIKFILDILPGTLAAFLIALIAVFLEDLLPIHLVGASVMALFLGMLLHGFLKNEKTENGLKFTSKRILKFAIILLGASLSIGTVIEVGKISLIVMFFTLLTCFGGGYFIGRALKLDWKLSNMISAGTGICGGSAIAAIAPVIEAKDKDIAYAMSATFLFDMVMILLFPVMGKLMGLNDMAYGLWAGTAINDTSSVVAAGYAYSEAAGDFATMVKLTRTLSIIPVVIVFAFVNVHMKKKEMEKIGQEDIQLKEKGQVESEHKVRFSSLFPWFITGFIALSAAKSVGLISAELSTAAKDLSKFLMVTALAAIGLNTSFREIKKSGPAPMLHGFIISLLVVIVSIVVEYYMGII